VETAGIRDGNYPCAKPKMWAKGAEYNRSLSFNACAQLTKLVMDILADAIGLPITNELKDVKYTQFPVDLRERQGERNSGTYSVAKVYHKAKYGNNN
jgi:hypothetical protein